MKSLAEAIHFAPFPSLPKSVRAIAVRVGVAHPIRVSELIRQLEVKNLLKRIVTDDGDPIGGQVEFTLYGDGRYEFKGYANATGFFSYHYQIQAWAQGTDGVSVYAVHSGRIYGTDSPGRSRYDNWSQTGVAPILKDRWPSLRGDAQLGFRFDAHMSGPTGDLWDVLKALGESSLAGALLGPAGALIVVGYELASAMNLAPTPGQIAGVSLTGGMMLVFGPFAIIPSIAAGVAVRAMVDSDLIHRSMTPDERAFANKVFRDTLPYDKILLTNLTHDGGTKYTIPDVFGTILVNLGAALSDYNDPQRWVDLSSGSDYTQPGAVFIHELTHAWQIAREVFVPGLLCKVSKDYGYHPDPKNEASRLVDLDWSRRPWKSFTLEQQAHIVDDWYGAHHTDLDSSAAVSDAAFHFIRDHIRAGIA